MSFIKFMEEKFAGSVPNVTNATAETNKTALQDAYSSIKGAIAKVSGTATVFTTKQCQGFCQVPKHLMYRNDVGADGDTPVTSCSVFLTGYFVALIQTFIGYCMWHSKFCLLHLFLVGIQYFKMPALSMEAESQQIKEEKSKFEKYFDKKW